MIRNRVRTLALAVLAAAAPAGGARAQQALPPAQQIVEKYVQAIGGHDALARINSRHEVGEVTIPAMGMTMPMEAWYARPNRVYTKVDMSGMTMLQGVSNGVAWGSSPMQGPRIVSGDELKQALDLSNFDNGFDFAKVFPTMETVGDRTVNGHACWNVKMTSAAGTEVHHCFDKETGLLVSTNFKQKGQMGEVDAESVVNSWGEFGGVKMPTSVSLNIGAQQLVTTIRAVTFEAIPDTQFEMPAEVKALQH